MHLSVLHHFFNFSQHQFVDPDTVFASINQQNSSSISLNWKMRKYYKVQVKSFQTDAL